MTGEEYNNQFSEEELKHEVWKPIPDFEGYYEASTLGRIRSLGRYVMCRGGNKRLIKGRLLRPRLYKDGYFDAKLHKDKDKYKTCRINRLIALTFISNPNNLPVVNHKDENPLNNRVPNLEWCTQKYNVNYGSSIQRSSKSRGTKISQYDKQYNLIHTYDSIREAARVIKGAHQNISKAAIGKYKTSYGYIWKYADEK